MADAEIYKITVKNAAGDELISYVLPPAKQMYIRSMMEEYGNATAEPMAIADVPADVDVPR